MPATLKLFKKSLEETGQGDAATVPMSKSAVVETTAKHDRQSLQDDSTEMDRFVRSSN